ncbi:MAG: ATP-binding protein [Dehalococcoidia bacterium]|nr:ATP-binding protein [Dehalococcoidia bacterium]
MSWMFPPYATVFIVAVVMALLFAWASWQRRPAPGAAFFAALMMAIGIWSFFRVLEAVVVEPWGKVLWAKFEYFGIASSGLFWLLFTCDFTGNDRWMTARNIGLLSVIPVASIVLAFTNDWHGLIWSSVDPSPSRPDVLVYHHGAAFWVMAVFNYGLLLTGAAMLIHVVIGRQRVYRRQVFALLAGVIIPLAGNFIYLVGRSPVPGLDLTPFAFVITGLVYVVTFYGFQLFGVVPVTRNVLIDSLNDGVVVLDRNYKITDINPAARQMLSAIGDLAVGQRAESLLNAWPGLIAQGSAGWPLPPDTLQLGETPRFVETRVFLLYNRRGQVNGRLIVLHDVTERKRAEEAIRTSQAELRKAHAELEKACQEEQRLRQELQAEIARRDEYFRVLVHEMRNSLAAIVASSELLKDVAGEGDATTVANNIRRSALELDRRVAELLDLARGEMGLLKVQARPVDLSLLLHQIVDETSPQASGKRHTLVLEAPETLPPVRADETRVRQIVLNLLNNAFKFTPAGGKIAVRARVETQDQILVQVEDNGPGMDEETKTHLFDPYWKRSVRKGGEGSLGIGLALSKLLVELQGGRISVESEQGKGTTISFTLPVAGT